MPYTQLVTVGYDQEKEKYIATVVDSMSGYRWLAEGTVDDTGNKLTMETEGPFPFRDAPLSRFQDVTEFKSADHKIFTSSIQEEDGSWTTLMKFEQNVSSRMALSTVAKVAKTFWLRLRPPKKHSLPTHTQIVGDSRSLQVL
ncbi:DUF1579 family protein [Verrucomicrobium spinosum]|uniref:DUF1579 family protein n=1 Tax=Verrucomicrobium spinosum TaxID=2736 RepID=UPI0009465D6B|nr:DUF1579 family protein [Verrucomicrobium spinosum]